MNFAVAELERRLANLLRIGTVEKVDAQGARVRVRMGALLTAPLPWLTERAGKNRNWNAPDVGEQVLVLSPSGDLEQGVVLPALYQKAGTPPEQTVDRTTQVFADGSRISYDRAAHALVVDVKAGGTVTVNVEGAVQVNGKSTVHVKGDGKVTVEGQTIEMNPKNQAMKGVVTGDCICAFTGNPHLDMSTTVKAGR